MKQRSVLSNHESANRSAWQEIRPNCPQLGPSVVINEAKCIRFVIAVSKM